MEKHSSVKIGTTDSSCRNTLQTDPQAIAFFLRNDMRHRFARSGFAVLLVLLSAMAANGDAINTFPSTGEGLPTGVVDPNFTIVSAPTGATLHSDGATDTIPPVTS